MKRTLILAIALASATPAAAENWVSLGGVLNSEIDLHSVGQSGSLPVARMRYGGQRPQGIITMTMELGAMCGEGYLYILDGAISSDWSPTIAAMPDLPKEDRVIWIPSQNEAFNNFFLFLCRG